MKAMTCCRPLRSISAWRARQDAAIGFEIKLKGRPRDIVRSTGQLDDSFCRVVAMGRIADVAERVRQRSDEVDHDIGMALRKIAPRRDHLELERCDRFGRDAEPAIALLDRKQVFGLAERNGVALPALQACGAQR